MVVKCTKCDLYFTHTAEDTKCPFCKTEYVKVEEKPVEEVIVEEKTKEKKVTAKTRKDPKESFKIW